VTLKGAFDLVTLHNLARNLAEPKEDLKKIWYRSQVGRLKGRATMTSSPSSLIHLTWKSVDKLGKVHPMNEPIDG
jgi:hypothetical protein